MRWAAGQKRTARQPSSSGSPIYRHLKDRTDILSDTIQQSEESRRNCIFRTSHYRPCRSDRCSARVIGEDVLPPRRLHQLSCRTCPATRGRSPNILLLIPYFSTISYVNMLSLDTDELGHHCWAAPLRSPDWATPPKNISTW